MRYQQNNEVVARTVAGAHLLIPVSGASQSLYTLNETGGWLWKLIAQPQTEEQLAAALREHYELSGEVARRDVRAFLDDMVRMSLAEQVA